MFDKSLDESKDSLIIKLIGDLDVYSEEEFKTFAEDNLNKAGKDMIFDLEKLDYLDSTGLGLFMNIYKEQQENGKTVKIINAKDNIAKLFKITDLSELFEME